MSTQPLAQKSLEIFARVGTVLVAACSHRRRCGSDIALVGDTALTISALIDEIKAQTGGKGAGDRAAVESEVAALKGLWLKEWCADHAPLCICSCIVRLRSFRVLFRKSHNNTAQDRTGAEAEP